MWFIFNSSTSIFLRTSCKRIMKLPYAKLLHNIEIFYIIILCYIIVHTHGTEWTLIIKATHHFYSILYCKLYTRKEQNHVRKYFLNLELKSRERCYCKWVFFLGRGDVISGLLLESIHACVVVYIGWCILFCGSKWIKIILIYFEMVER